MNSHDHHVISLTFGPPVQLTESSSWVRTLAWIDSGGRLHDLHLHAELGPECLLLLGENLATARGPHEAPPSESPLARGPLPVARLDRYAGQAIGVDPAKPGADHTATYLLPREYHGNEEGMTDIPDEGRVNLREEAAPQARFKVGDKVTPISLENHCHFLKAGGVYKVAAEGHWVNNTNGPDDCIQSVSLEGMYRFWPASQFRLADPLALPADCPNCLRSNPEVPTGVNVICCHCGSGFMAGD